MPVRDECKNVDKEYEKTEDDLKALQSVGQIIGEVLKQLDDERFIVKASSGPRYVVGCRNKVDKALLKPTARVALDMTTLTIMRLLPREVRARQRDAQTRHSFGCDLPAWFGFETFYLSKLTHPCCARAG